MSEMCEHVYRHMGKPECPLCGKNTHEINWKEVSDQHKEWIDSGKATYGGWWSI